MILFFGSKNCAPCVELKRNFDAKDIKYQYIDVEENNVLVRKYDIQSIPTILFLRDGVVVDSYIGNGNNLWGKITKYE